MSSNSQSQGTYRLPDALAEDLANMEKMVAQFKEGSISAAQFRAFRVPLGVYEQRQDGAFMLRVRLPAGGLLPGQMRVAAEVSTEYGNGVLHITTRQDIQVHEVPLENIHPALTQMAPAKLSTKGGGGNTVRNISACCDAGVCPREAFDVTPYALALTEYLMADPLSFRLPRKYKIAFSGCSQDCAGATVNDLGFIATQKEGKLGFTAYIGGGMGSAGRVSDLFEEFISADEIHLMAEAVKRVFDKHGNRKDKHQARLRFLIRQIGLDRFRALYAAELNGLYKAETAALAVSELPAPQQPQDIPNAKPLEAFPAWRTSNTLPQKQTGYYLVHIPLFLGDIAADTLKKLADIVAQHGERMVRTTQSQNLVLRWAHEDELPALHRSLAALGLAETLPPILRNLVPCAGAATCRLGICLSRGLARAIHGQLIKSDLELESLGDLNIHISGCPNSCGRHPVGRIGLFGAARRVGGKLAPHYILQLGGKVTAGETRFAQGKLAVPARNVPTLITEFLRLFSEAPEFPDYDAFLKAHTEEALKSLAEKYGSAPAFDEDKNYYYDWDADDLFSLAGRGPGECSAGVFDLIQVDLAGAAEAFQSGRLFAATVLAARSLLATQGLEAANDAEALRLFATHFVDKGLVRESFNALLDQALAVAGFPEPDQELAPAEVKALVQAVQGLYENMDQSLRFHATPQTQTCTLQTCALQSDAPVMVQTASEYVSADREADFRGVACPLNYVKTKLLLEQMSSGEVLSVLLDQDGARNVPQSTKQDGNNVLSVTQEENGWRMVIRKA